MKKILSSLLLVSVMLVGTVGCSLSNKKDKEQGTTQESYGKEVEATKEEFEAVLAKTKQQLGNKAVFGEEFMIKNKNIQSQKQTITTLIKDGNNSFYSQQTLSNIVSFTSLKNSSDSEFIIYYGKGEKSITSKNKYVVKSETAVTEKAKQLIGNDVLSSALLYLANIYNQANLLLKSTSITKSFVKNDVTGDITFIASANTGETLVTLTSTGLPKKYETSTTQGAFNSITQFTYSDQTISEPEGSNEYK